MRFDIITIFPKAFDSYLSSSIIGRAVKKRLVQVNFHDLRSWTKDKHRTVDDKPYGGGPGMVLKIEPIAKEISSILRNSKSKTLNPKQIQKSKFQTRLILLSAKGKLFTQKDAKRLGKYRRLILISGHYEGVDERVKKYLVDEELSIGQYVLTGGELPAMVVVDACARLIPGVLGKQESLEDESFSKEGYLEYPQYTRPEVFQPLAVRHRKSDIRKPKSEKWRVPKILLSGDHKKIQQWREKNAKMI